MHFSPWQSKTFRSHHHCREASQTGKTALSDHGTNLRKNHKVSLRNRIFGTGRKLHIHKQYWTRHSFRPSHPYRSESPRQSRLRSQSCNPSHRIAQRPCRTSRLYRSFHPYRPRRPCRPRPFRRVASSPSLRRCKPRFRPTRTSSCRRTPNRMRRESAEAATSMPVVSFVTLVTLVSSPQEASARSVPPT